MARPQKAIDSKNFDALCSLHCTLEEIASFFECSPDTIERWCKRELKENYAEVYKKKSGVGKISLRRMQWKSAESGNIAMQIFLGKQILGQKDNPEIEENAETLERLMELLKSQTELAKKAK